MSAIQQDVHKGINLIFDLTEKPNTTHLKDHEDRADLILSTNKIFPLI